MKYSTIGYILGQVLKFEGIFMLLPFLTGMIYHEDVYKRQSMSFVSSCSNELTKFMSNHIFCYEYRHMFSSVMNSDCMTNELREDCRTT